jgi:FkbM family methyltransferase
MSGTGQTIFLRRKTATGLLFEPSEQCISVLEAKFKAKPVTLRNVAIGDYSGFVSFCEEEDCGEGSSVRETHDKYSGTVRKISLVTLDEELLDSAINVDFLKIDTEGYDLRVLKGAETLLRVGRIRFIQFEYNAHWLGVGSSLAEALCFLENFGFQLLLIRSSGLHPLNYAFWGDYFRYSNFLAYSREDKHLINCILSDKM